MIDVESVRSVSPPSRPPACLTLLTVLGCGPLCWQGCALCRGRSGGARVCLVSQLQRLDRGVVFLFVLVKN